MKLFCLAYAGGSAGVYNSWKDELKTSFDVIPMEYAGRGNRFCDDFYETMEELAEDIGNEIKGKVSGTDDYIIYGHSMGCLAALEVSYYLKSKNIKMPKAIIVAATRPPHLMYKDRELANLSKDELMKDIAKLGQMEAEIFEEPELYEIVSDVLYADIQMMAKYKRSNSEKLNIPIIAMFGAKDDEAPAVDMKEWGTYTNGEFTLKEFAGEHFFAFNNNSEFMNYMKAMKI